MSDSKQFIASAIVALAAIFFFVFTLPAISKTRTVIQDYGARKEKLEEVLALARTIEKNVQIIEQNKGLQDRLNRSIPDDKYIAEAIADIERFARIAGTTLESISINEQKSRDQNGPRPLEARLELLGSYNQFAQLIGSFEQNLRIFDVLSLEASRPLLAQGDQLRAELRFQFYYLSPQEAEANAKPAAASLSDQ